MRLSFIDCRMVSCSVSLWAVLGTFHCSLSLSLWGFQLPIFRADWCSSAVIFLSPRGFQLPTFCAGWFSTANLSCWLVLIRCNLLSLSSGVSAAILSRSRVLFCRLQPSLSLLGSLSSQCVPSCCCSRIVYILYQKVVHVKLE